MFFLKGYYFLLRSDWIISNKVYGQTIIFYAALNSKNSHPQFMKIEEKRPLIFLMASILVISGVFPVYAEVTSLKTDYATYDKGDQIKFSGTFEEESTGLITIVIRNSNDDFVMLTQAIMNPDNTFERTVNTEPKFSLVGTHNATAFIYNMTEGISINFEYGKSKTPHPIPETETNDDIVTVSEPQGPLISENTEPVVEESTINNDTKLADFVDPTKDPQYYIDRYNNESAYQEWFDKNYPHLTIQEAVGYELPKLADFVDPTKDPQYYIDRYNNESAYQEWFDKNYPHLTIQEAVGYEKVESVIEDTKLEGNTYDEDGIENNIEEIISSEILPDAQASTLVEPVIQNTENNSELTQMILALAGLAVLFGAVYGIKRKVDNNTEQISENRKTIKKKLLGNILHHDPLDVIKDRLAKGEMSVDEYDKVKNALKKE